MSTTNGPGRPSVDTELVRSRLPRELLDEIDSYAAETGIDRPAAVRLAIREWRHDRISGIQQMEGLATAFGILLRAMAPEQQDVAIDGLVGAVAKDPNQGVKSVVSAILGELAKR